MIKRFDGHGFGEFFHSHPYKARWATYWSPTAHDVSLTHRYDLWSIWGGGPIVNWLMLNPSTAGANRNDPTVERCERRSRALGYGGMVVTNLFALRHTDPRLLVCGDGDDYPEWAAALERDAIMTAAALSSCVVCAWGDPGPVALRRLIRERARRVLDLLRPTSGEKLHVLALTKEGIPRHPLYLPYEMEPKRWEA